MLLSVLVRPPLIDRQHATNTSFFLALVLTFTASEPRFIRCYDRVARLPSCERCRVQRNEGSSRTSDDHTRHSTDREETANETPKLIAEIYHSEQDVRTTSPFPYRQRFFLFCSIRCSDILRISQLLPTDLTRKPSLLRAASFHGLHWIRAVGTAFLRWGADETKANGDGKLPGDANYCNPRARKTHFHVFNTGNTKDEDNCFALPCQRKLERISYIPTSEIVEKRTCKTVPFRIWKFYQSVL